MDEVEKLIYMANCVFEHERNFKMTEWYDRVVPYYDEEYNNLDGLDCGNRNEAGDMSSHKYRKIDILFDYLTMGMVEK